MLHHIIHTQRVRLQVARQEHTWDLQNRVSRLLREDIVPALDSLFNEISPNGETLRIEKLEIDLGKVSEQDIEREFKEKLISQLREILVNQGTNITKSTTLSLSPGAVNNILKVEKKQSLLESLLYFLERGYLPWYVVVTGVTEWEGEITRSFSEKEWETLIHALQRDVKSSGVALKRLAYQFSETFLEKFLLTIMPALKESWKKIYDDVFNLITDKFFIWENFLKVALRLASINEFEPDFVKEVYADPEIQKTVKEIFSKGEQIKQIQSLKLEEALRKNFEEDATPVNSTETKKTNKKASKLTQEVGALFVANAGLIILHPFIQLYFEELGLTDKKRFKNDLLQRRATLLLHYLATNETKVAEMHLLLPKLLCNMNFEEPVENEIALSEMEIQESENLLRSVLKHWTPLNRTSVEGLQQTFLQREGKLTQKENGWLLQVEQKTVDILLNKLPWGIGTIKLPWMKNFLSVEWN